MDTTILLPLRLVLPILFVYLVISILGLHYHELALEEAQFFLFGRDSDSLSSLYRNMAYEGHPRLWCALLFFINHYITTGPAGMQALHLAVSGATVFLFLRYAPFGTGIKILVISGYYFLFEYDLLSRNYAPGILLLFICCILLRDPRKNLLWIGCMLVLLCNTHLFFAFSAIGIFAYLLSEYGRQKKIRSLPFFIFTLLTVAGVGSALVQGRISEADYLLPMHREEWFSAKNLSVACYALIRGWLPIPKIHGGNFWNSFWLDDNNIGWIARDLLFIVALVFPAVLLGKFRSALLFYYTSLILFLAFFVVHPIVASRYFGVGFVFFLAACWIADRGSGDFFSLKHLADRPVTRLVLRDSLYALLAVQAVIGIYALEQDLTRPFSQAKNAIAYIRAHQLDRQELVVDGYIAGPALSVYAGKPLFYLDIGQKGSYCLWKSSYFPKPRPTLEQEMTGSAFLHGLDRFVLLSNRQVDTGWVDEFHVAPLAAFPNSITSMENSYLYQVTRREGGHPLTGILRLHK